MLNLPEESQRSFAVISVLGAPGAGKGTLCTHLVKTHNLKHHSVGDDLRAWMRANRGTPLAAEIQCKLDNQGFLSPGELKPFLCRAIEKSISRKGYPQYSGLLLDGFPRNIEQQVSLSTWSLLGQWPIVPNQGVEVIARPKPDIVLFFRSNKQNAKARYLDRARDRDDSEEKFERRFAEYETETLPVLEAYRKRGIVIEIDVNGNKEENIESLAKELEITALWRSLVVEGDFSAVAQG